MVCSPAGSHPLSAPSDCDRIPFERALDFANKEKITDLLYPLFVHNIAELLYHPTNSSQTNMVVQDSQQRRLEGPQARTPQAPQPPALHHHHSLQTPLPPHMSQPPQSMSSQPGGRPVLDRAHTFPTPPASASSLMGIGHQGGSIDWSNQGMNSGVSNPQPLSIDALGNARSLPSTPATTPPGSGLQGMPSYQSHPGYDSTKNYYSTAPPPQSQYASQSLPPPGMTSYGQPLPSGSYIKADMPPPSGRSGGTAEAEVAETKPDRYGQEGGQAGAGETVPEQESEYIHDSTSSYPASRGSYTYTSNPSIGTLTGDHSQLTPDLTGSPSHQNSSGRMTPRTSGGPPSQWSSGYNTPPRPAVGSLYNIVSDTRGSSANGTPPDAYNPASGYSGMNGSMGIKRLRDDDDADRIARPDSRGADYESKRRKTLTEAPVGGPVGGAPLALQPVKAGGVMPRRR